jgi:ankyrin repeat protein
MDLDDLVLSKDVIFGRHQEVENKLMMGANANEANSYGYSNLHTAAWNGDITMIEILIRYGANVNAHSSVGMTPLHLASSCKNSEVAIMLIQNGADIHLTNHKGQSCLYGFEEEERSRLHSIYFEDDTKYPEQQ